MVPRMEMGEDSQKTGCQCDVYNSCFSFGGFADAVGSESIDGVRGLRGFDGADGSDGGFDGGFDGVDGGFDGSDAPMALMVLASVALVASMVWVTSLKRRELSNEMRRYSPLKNLAVLFDETGLDPEARDGLTLSK